MKYYLGIDLGGTKVSAAVVKVQHGEYTLEKAAVNPVSEIKDSDLLMDKIAETVISAIEYAGITKDKISGCGMGVPGVANSGTGVLERAVNLILPNPYPIAEELEKRLSQKQNSLEVPVIVGNDADCAAFGEYLAGVGKEFREKHNKKHVDLVCVTLGTGVGSGIVLGGKIHSGFNYSGGEFGHTVIMAEGGRKCGCGRCGCYEQYAAGTALKWIGKEAADKNPGSLINTIAKERRKKIDGEIVFEAAKRGDETAAAAVERYAGFVACGLVNLINTMQPDIICIGGGVCAQKGLLPLIKKKVNQKQYNRKIGDKNDKTHVCIASLENDAGIIGAAMLCLN